MLKRKYLLVCVLVPLYVGTWIGGWISHAQELTDHAEASYRAGETEDRIWAAEAKKRGMEFHSIRLHEGGPESRVLWCVPVLPGILLADSYYSVGPRWASGGVKVVFYYGFGSTELFLEKWES